MKSTLEQMKQDLQDHFQLAVYPKTFNEFILNNEIDKLIFVAYLEAKTDDPLLKWISETSMKNFIYNLYLLFTKSKEFKIDKEPGIIKINIDDLNLRHLILYKVQTTIAELIELIQTRYKGYKVYFDNFDEDFDTSQVKIIIVLHKEQ